MAGSREDIGHELAALFALVNSIVAACEFSPGSVAYTPSTEKFRKHIIDLGRMTADYLIAFPAESESIGEGEEDSGSPPRELEEIKWAWKQLHAYIRPAMQADTLHQPTSLVDAFEERFHSIDGLAQTTFTIFHADEFNYLHLYPAEIGRLTNKLAKMVGASEVPEFGLIGIPGSQSSTLFLNCLIAHEMGHYVAASKRFLAHILGEAETSLKLKMKEKYPTGKLSFELPAKLGRWAEELFCDLFAVELIGPCYTFAYIELYDQLQMLRLDGTLHRDRLQTALAFYASYPSHPFRVQRQALLLRDSGWWKYISEGKSRHVKLLTQIINVANDDHKKANTDSGFLVEAFLEIIPTVVRFLGEVTGKLPDFTHEFGSLQTTILQYLENAIVPSTLNVKSGAELHIGVRPSAVSLVNAGMTFYLERIPDLMKQIAGEDTNSLERRMFWMRKVEGWLAKALEDVRLRETAENGSIDS